MKKLKTISLLLLLFTIAPLVIGQASPQEVIEKLKSGSIEWGQVQGPMREMILTTDLNFLNTHPDEFADHMRSKNVEIKLVGKVSSYSNGVISGPSFGSFDLTKFTADMGSITIDSDDHLVLTPTGKHSDGASKGVVIEKARNVRVINGRIHGVTKLQGITLESGTPFTLTKDVDGTPIINLKDAKIEKFEEGNRVYITGTNIELPYNLDDDSGNIMVNQGTIASEKGQVYVPPGSMATIEHMEIQARPLTFGNKDIRLRVLDKSTKPQRVNLYFTDEEKKSGNYVLMTDSLNTQGKDTHKLVMQGDGFHVRFHKGNPYFNVDNPFFNKKLVNGKWVDKTAEVKAKLQDFLIFAPHNNGKITAEVSDWDWQWQYNGYKERAGIVKDLDFYDWFSKDPQQVKPPTVSVTGPDNQKDWASIINGRYATTLGNKGIADMDTDIYLQGSHLGVVPMEVLVKDNLGNNMIVSKVGGEFKNFKLIYDEQGGQYFVQDDAEVNYFGEFQCRQ